MKVGVVVPHIFMQESILPHVIFAPGKLAIDLAEGLQQLGNDVTLFTPGKVNTNVSNTNTDLSYFEQELRSRNDTYITLLKKHPLTFITLARQVQSELIAKAYQAANNGELDIVHVYTNEEDIALPFAQLCQKPVVFTHHDPFNFLASYRNNFPKYKHYPWISMSHAQRAGMPADTNWLANIYHGLDVNLFTPNYKPQADYLAYMGRIIEPKGLHLAIKALRMYNSANKNKLRMKIAGKHYSGSRKDKYWLERIQPELADDIEYVGFIRDRAAKQAFLADARALLVPSIYEEPFGMVMLESLACATPVIGLDSGAIPELIESGINGFVAPKVFKSAYKGQTIKKVVDEDKTAALLAELFDKIDDIDRRRCRERFEAHFTLERMCQEHISAYAALLGVRLQNN